jgi:hypothetical protein
VTDEKLPLNRVQPCVQIAFAASLLSVIPTPGTAQWLNYPTAGVPRKGDGSANLAAPAPRTADGKPDLSGTVG